MSTVKDDIQLPLVSIIVITYNSAKYVLETLESAKEQTYENIELIVSDDGSKDDTVEICRAWLAANSSRFVRTELLTVVENTGIPANCNRGVQASQGEWIKLIAGDDCLMPECITLNIDFVQEKKEAQIVQSECEHYKDNFENSSYLATTQLAKKRFFASEVKNGEQLKIMLNKNQMSAPAVFFCKNLYNLVGGFDEDFKLLEDYPFWLKILKSKVEISILNVPTVKYRLHINSVQKQRKPYMNKRFAKEILMVNNKYVKSEVGYFKNMLFQFKYRSIWFLDQIGFNNSSKLSKLLYFILYRL